MPVDFAQTDGDCNRKDGANIGHERGVKPAGGEIKHRNQPIEVIQRYERQYTALADLAKDH